MITTTLSMDELCDILVSLGGRLPPKRVLGEGFTGNQRLALRERLGALLSAQLPPSPVAGLGNSYDCLSPDVADTEVTVALDHSAAKIPDSLSA